VCPPADLSTAAAVVGFTITEDTPRQEMRLQRLLDGKPL
jgi:hypothetical protein